MDHQREAFSRLSAQDEGMMGSPHGTPVKKVRRQRMRRCFAPEESNRGKPNKIISMRICVPRRVKTLSTAYLEANSYASVALCCLFLSFVSMLASSNLRSIICTHRKKPLARPTANSDRAPAPSPRVRKNPPKR